MAKNAGDGAIRRLCDDLQKWADLFEAYREHPRPRLARELKTLFTRIERTTTRIRKQYGSKPKA